MSVGGVEFPPLPPVLRGERAGVRGGSVSRAIGAFFAKTQVVALPKMLISRGTLTPSPHRLSPEYGREGRMTPPLKIRRLHFRLVNRVHEPIAPARCKLPNGLR